MFQVPIDFTAAERAQWLAQLSDALEEAQALVWRIGLDDPADRGALDLYLRIEAARLEVRSLRLGRLVQPGDNPGPIWTKTSPWQPQATGGL